VPILVRLAKLLALACLAFVVLLAAFTNIQDYDANFAYVQHVLSMDTTFRHPQVMWRAVTSPSLHRLAYVTIIVWEVVGGVVCGAGAWRLASALRRPQADVDRAKRTGVAGLTIVFGLWTYAFLVVASEWFLMWQSPTWNGRDVAMGYAILSLLTLIWFSAPEER
jgi:predicted small integral membrane protein